MTPLLPTPNHYLHNLITMTSSEATRLWRKASRKPSTAHAFIVENLMNYMNLLLITFVLAVLAGKRLQATSCQPVPVAIKEKVVMSGRVG